MIRLCCPLIIPHITHLVNSCLVEGVFPEIWKSALVCPLPKVSNPETLRDLRPISLLPVLSKVAERVISIQLTEYLSVFDVLPVTQSGFRPGYSCETALLKVTDDLIDAVDKGMLSCLVLLDFSHAFDTVNHSVLLAILEHIGFDATAVSLFRNYLINRSQSVRLNGSLSSPRTVLYGVPQGSILGPILFTIYTSNLLADLKYIKSHIYADDTQLYYSFPPSDWRVATSRVNEDLQQLFSKSLEHNLILNPAKSKVILFGPKRVCKEISTVFRVAINNINIPIVDKAKSLGLILDNTFRYRDQISLAIRNAYINLKKLFPFRHIFNEKVKRNLCDSFVLSQFSFCSPIYHACLDNISRNRIQKVQNACLRYIYGIRKFDHISHKLLSAQWLNMQNRRLLRILSLFHKIILTKTPPYLYNKIRYRTDVHNLLTRFRGRISPPVHKTVLFESSFTYQIYLLYNRLPLHFLSCSMSLFKSKIFQFLFLKQCEC